MDITHLYTLFQSRKDFFFCIQKKFAVKIQICKDIVLISKRSQIISWTYRTLI